MSFTTPIFLYLFFPIAVCSFCLVGMLTKRGVFFETIPKIRAKELVLIGISLCFYAWANVANALRLCLYIIMVYFAGRWIERTKRNGTSICLVKGTQKDSRLLPISAIVLFITVVLMSFWPLYAKYSNLLIKHWNWLLQDSVESKSVSAALGLSFITFSAISYLVDIYRGNASPGTLIDCALYITFFPKVVSGPIVLWKDFKDQIHCGRTESEYDWICQKNDFG